MCQRIQCEQCHKPTYAGCGKHIEQVLRGVVEADRCHCQRGKRSQGPVAHHGHQHADAARSRVGVTLRSL